MKKLLAILAAAVSPIFGTALAADGAGNASDEEKDPTMKDLAAALTTLTGNVANLTTSVATLTSKVDNFAGRGHQVAVVMAVPRRLQVATTTRPNVVHVDYYLVGNSTIPGFPTSTVAADGKFASYNVPLPAGTYLFEMQNPYDDQLLCHGKVAVLKDAGSGHALRNEACTVITLKVRDTTLASEKKILDGLIVYRVTAATGGRFYKHFRFPAGTTFTHPRGRWTPTRVPSRSRS